MKKITTNWVLTEGGGKVTLPPDMGTNQISFSYAGLKRSAFFFFKTSASPTSVVAFREAARARPLSAYLNLKYQ